MEIKSDCCASCGFLAKVSDFRPSGSSTEFHELELYDRAAPEVFRHIKVGTETSISTIPSCFQYQSDLMGEIAERDRAKVIAVLNRPRNCKKWHPYTPGRSPKEHLEDLMASELELRRQEFELRLFELSRKLQDQAHAFNRRVTWFLLFLAGVEILANLLPLAYPAGSQSLMRLVGNVPPIDSIEH